MTNLLVLIVEIAIYWGIVLYFSKSQKVGVGRILYWCLLQTAPAVVLSIILIELFKINSILPTYVGLVIGLALVFFAIRSKYGLELAKKITIGWAIVTIVRSVITELALLK